MRIFLMSTCFAFCLTRPILWESHESTAHFERVVIARHITFCIWYLIGLPVSISTETQIWITQRCNAKPLPFARIHACSDGGRVSGNIDLKIPRKVVMETTQVCGFIWKIVMRNISTRYHAWYLRYVILLKVSFVIWIFFRKLLTFSDFSLKNILSSN